MSASTTAATRRSVSGPVLLGAAFAFTTLLSVAFQAAEIVFTDRDPNRPQGPIESIQNIALFGGVAVLLAVAIVLPLRHDPAKAKIGAIVLGVLSLLTLPFFWSGAPAIFGAGAAWLAGLAPGAEPQTGAARGFGVVGLVIAAILMIAVPVLYIAGFVTAAS